ncbi:7389_t:CDS:2, partial [Dentiscutata heterogama]
SQPDKEKAITPDPMPKIEHSSTQIQKAESSTTFLPQNIIDINIAKTFDFVEMKHKERVTEPFYKNQNLELSIILQSISNSSELSLDNNSSNQSNSSCGFEFKLPTNLLPN